MRGAGHLLVRDGYVSRRDLLRPMLQVCRKISSPADDRQQCLPSPTVTDAAGLSGKQLALP